MSYQATLDYLNPVMPTDHRNEPLRVQGRRRHAALRGQVHAVRAGVRRKGGAGQLGSAR